MSFKQNGHTGAKKDLNAKVYTAMMCMTRQCWEQGILAQSLLDMQEYEDLKVVAYDMVLRQSKDGRLCNIENTPAIVDSSFCIPATLAAGTYWKEPTYTQAALKNIHYLVYEAPRAADGTLYHMVATQEVWADSAAFSPAVLAQAGHHQLAVNQMEGILKRLKDPLTGLYRHVWNDETNAYKRDLLWGVGNGWILTGLLRLYLALPKEKEAERGRIKELFDALLERMVQSLNENGFLYNAMDDDTSFEETEATEMLAYAIYEGCAYGMVSPDYLALANRVVEVVENRVSEDGLVMGCASSPDFEIYGTSVEGQAHFLMMQAARQKVAEQQA